jgi:hypothetical protein
LCLAIISSATPNSTTTTCSVIPELATPANSDKALDMDVMGDTAPMHAICFPGGLNDRTSEEHVDDVSLTLWSFSQILQHMPPRLLADAYKVFHDACSVTAFVPWPPPSCTHSKSPLLNEHDLFHNVQLKHGKEFIAVWVRSTLLPTSTRY